MLRAYICKFEADWDLLLPYLKFAYNTQMNTVTKYTPFFLQFGRLPNCPIDVSLRAVVPELVSTDEYARKVEENMQEVFQLVAERRKIIGEAVAREYNVTHQTKVYKKGDRVLIVETVKVPGYNKKLLPKRQRDVHEIVEVLSKQSYIVKNLRTAYIGGRITGAMLIPYHERKKKQSLTIPNQSEEKRQEGTTPTQGEIAQSELEDVLRRRMETSVEGGGTSGVDDMEVTPPEVGAQEKLRQNEEDKEVDLFGTGGGRRSTEQRIVQEREDSHGQHSYRVKVHAYKKGPIFTWIPREKLEGTLLLKEYEATQKVKKACAAPQEVTHDGRPVREKRPVYKPGYIHGLEEDLQS